MANPVQLTALSTEPRRDRGPLRIKHQDKAAWSVGGKGFFDDKSKFWPAGSSLYFDGEPNVDLYPLNKFAHDSKQKLLDKLDRYGELAAKKANKAYVPLPREEWNENGDHEDIPMPKYVLGVPIKESEFNESIG